MSNFTPAIPEGSLMGFVGSNNHHIEDTARGQQESEVQSVEETRDISTIGQLAVGKRRIPIFTDAGQYEAVPEVVPKDPMHRNYPA